MPLNNFLQCPHRNIQTYTEYCLDCGWNVWTTKEEYYKELARRNPSKHKDKDYDDNYNGDF